MFSPLIMRRLEKIFDVSMKNFLLRFLKHGFGHVLQTVAAKKSNEENLLNMLNEAIHLFLHRSVTQNITALTLDLRNVLMKAY